MSAALISRALMKGGPARVVVGAGGPCFFTVGDVVVKHVHDREPKGTPAFGTLDYLSKSMEIRATCTPAAQISAGIVGAILPYVGANSMPGLSIIGAADRTIAFHCQDQSLGTIIAGAVSKMPSLNLGMTKELWGSMEFVGVRKLNSSWNTADSLFTLAETGGTYLDSSFTHSGLVKQTWIGAYGSVTGMTTIYTTEDGWTVDFNVDIQPVPASDCEGIVNYKIGPGGVTALVRCTPAGLVTADVISASGMHSGARGTSMAAGSSALTITGADTHVVTFPQATMVEAGFNFGTITLRQGEIGFVVTPTITAGVYDDLFSITYPA